MDKIIIWGLGRYCKSVMRERMIPLNVIEAIVDADENRQGEFFLGKEILSPSRLGEFSSRVIVVGSPIFYDEIAAQINDKYQILSIIEFAEKYPGIEVFSTAVQLREEEKSPLVKTIEECNAIWEEFKNVMVVRKIADNSVGNKVRVGKKNDGGYIMIEDAIKKAKIAYSIGIGNDVSWDMQIAEQYGCDVFQYDDTINTTPMQHEKFHFMRTGICGSKRDFSERMTLEQMLKENHHENETDMILKMDVEGAEWDVIETITEETISKFNQIVMEIHELDDINQIEDKLKYLMKINKTHQLVHIHANNYMLPARRFAGKAILIRAYEVTYIKKDMYEFYDDDSYFPQEIDQPCNPAVLDIELGNWGKKND